MSLIVILHPKKNNMFRLFFYFFIFFLNSSLCTSQKDFEVLFGIDKKKTILYQILSLGDGNLGVAFEKIGIENKLIYRGEIKIDKDSELKYFRFYGNIHFKLFFKKKNFLTVKQTKKKLKVINEINEAVSYSFHLDTSNYFSKIKVKSKKVDFIADVDSLNFVYYANGERIIEKKEESKIYLHLDELFKMYFVKKAPYYSK